MPMSTSVIPLKDFMDEKKRSELREAMYQRLETIGQPRKNMTINFIPGDSDKYYLTWCTTREEEVLENGMLDKISNAIAETIGVFLGIQVESATYYHSRDRVGLKFYPSH